MSGLSLKRHDSAKDIYMYARDTIKHRHLILSSSQDKRLAAFMKNVTP